MVLFSRVLQWIEAHHFQTSAIILFDYDASLSTLDVIKTMKNRFTAILHTIDTDRDQLISN